MAYNRNQAKVLCTANEYALFEASLADRIKEHSAAQLRGKVKRARNLRDKYRDLFQRQRLANRERTGSKKGQRVDSNARTEQKARLFDEVLNRFERRAGDVQEASDRAVARAEPKARAGAGDKTGVANNASAGSKKRAAAPASARSNAPRAAARKGADGKPREAGFVSEAARGASRRQRLQKTRSKAVQGHTRAAGRRAQARRDRRN